MVRLIVAFTPLVGAIAFPLLIPTTIERLGLGPGVFSALVLSTLWFIAMLRTSEMPHWIESAVILIVDSFCKIIY